MQPSIRASYCNRIQDDIQDGALQYLRMYLSWVGMPSAVSLIARCKALSVHQGVESETILLWLNHHCGAYRQ